MQHFLPFFLPWLRNLIHFPKMRNEFLGYTCSLFNFFPSRNSFASFVMMRTACSLLFLEGFGIAIRLTITMDKLDYFVWCLFNMQWCLSMDRLKCATLISNVLLSWMWGKPFIKGFLDLIFNLNSKKIRYYGDCPIFKVYKNLKLKPLNACD